MSSFRATTLAQLEDFSSRLNVVFLEKSDNKDPQFRAFLQLGKIGEEFGEMCEATLALYGKQRSEKLVDRDSASELEDEMADVILATMNLAACLNLSVSQGLARKCAKVAARVGVEPLL